VADRNYLLSVFDPETGAVLGSQKKIAAIGASEDGKYGYVRQTDGLLIKIDPAGQPVWQVDARLGSVPAAPTEKNGMVYVSSDKGLISAVSAQDGRVVWQYQASPQLYVMSSVASDGTNAYVTSFDGTLTAIRATVSPDSPSRVRPSGLDQAR
jgi:outer membrane protein assembly factor BamB